MQALPALPSRPIPLGRIVFDPCFILSQIAVMQALFYLSLGAFLFVASAAFSRELALDQFFNAHALTLHTLHGAVTMLCHFLTVVPGAVALLLVVERSKRCLDFTITMHLVHLLLCCFWAFPGTFEWWALTAINVTTMTLIGEYLCVRRELREIPLQNPDERHLQQSQLVRQKQEQMREERAAGAARAAQAPVGGAPPPLWTSRGGESPPSPRLPAVSPRGQLGALLSTVRTGYARVPQAQGKE
eukprot:TRINITY_DN47648_c0_g1_i1.p1 TRINITY_DN47648_c0_g1~~TRINITY_DN47648_c0_g1_i1.p1  ORF type:complete len:244 (+),score=14.64 TRINITY_DN47648_c0_g1_i1:67-798(+)